MATVSAIIIVTNDVTNCEGSNNIYCNAINDAIDEIGSQNKFTIDYQIGAIKPSQSQQWGINSSGKNLPYVMFFINQNGEDKYGGLLQEPQFTKNKVKSKLLDLYGGKIDTSGGDGNGSGFFNLGSGLGFGFGFGGFLWIALLVILILLILIFKK